MVSRRLLRIKAMHIIYAFIQTPDKSINQAEKELFFSINKTYELYFLQVSLLLELVKLANEKIDKAKQKRLPSEDDLNPNTKFVDNKVLVQLSENQQFNDYIEQHKLNWNGKEEVLRDVFNSLLESEFYNEYMAAEESKYSDDKEFVLQLIENTIAENDTLIQALEEMSIFWNDDFEFVLSMIIRTVEGMSIGNTSVKKLIQLFKNEDDIDFVKNLYRKTLLKREANEALINKHIKNWELERIAQMDILLLLMAIAEISTFPTIPIKVSMNEYIELSKYYSTEKSKEFINGVLESVIADLKKEGKIEKVGRGLK